MALVTFVDDNPPYLNAQNLNNNFNELNNKGAITATLSANTTINVATSYVVEKIPLGYIKCEKDTNNIFSLDDGLIKVSKAGYYLVSANIMVNPNTDNARSVIGALTKTTGNTMSTPHEMYVTTKVSGYTIVSITPVILQLSANDKVGVGVSAGNTGNVVVGGTSNLFTSLTIVEL